jgi:hypothetical protein
VTRWSPAQRQCLDAMGYVVPERRTMAVASGPVALRDVSLPPRLRAGLERWMGPGWQEWPVPDAPAMGADFKRALWRRIRDWRRGA